MLTALIGLNGAGKTTTLRARYEKYGGIYTPDFPVIPTTVTAARLIADVGRMRRVPGADGKARELVDYLGIVSALDKPIGTYSAGNYKKTAIACALIVPSSRYYFDEPFETLDSASQARLLALLSQVAESGRDVQVSLQDLHQVEHCDVVEVYHEQACIAAGPPTQVLGSNPRQEFLRLIGATDNEVAPTWL